MRTLALLALTAAVLCTARSARAECAMPRPAVFPASGALPPHPTLYRFEPSYGPAAALRVEGPDGPVPFTARDVSASDAVRVTAIYIDAQTGPIEVFGGDGEVAHRYELIPQAAPAAPLVAPVVERVAYVRDAWTCSHTDGFAIELRAPRVAAFRARWTGGAEAIIAPNHHAYFASPDFPAEAEWAHVFLGHVSCAGESIPSRLIGRRDFTLTAIYADGTSHELALPREAASAPAAPPLDLPPPRTVAARPTWPWIAALSAASIGFVIALVRRRRRAIVP